MGKYDDKKPQSSKWVGILIFLMFANPALFIPLAVIGGIIYVAVKGQKTTQRSASAAPPWHPPRLSRRRPSCCRPAWHPPRRRPSCRCPAWHPPPCCPFRS